MKVIFVSTTKIGENTINILKLLFFIMNLQHFFTSNQISTYRKLNLLLKKYLFHFVTSRNAKKTRKD